MKTVYDKYKKAVITFICGHCFACLLLFLVIFLFAKCFDPLHLYSTSIDEDNQYFSVDERLQNAGYIRNFDFDSVIIGNSHMQNLANSKTGEYLDGKWFNLSVVGSRNNERRIILEDVFRRKQIKSVLLLLTNDLITFKTSDFEFLYDDNDLNDINIYLNEMYLKCFFKWVKSSVTSGNLDPVCRGEKLNVDEHSAWIYNPQYASRFGNMENWAENYQNQHMVNVLNDLNNYYSIPPRNLNKISDKDKAEIEKNVEENIESLVKAHPETTFYCYAQPYFKLEWALDLRRKEGKEIEIYLEFLKEYVKLASKYKNFKLYGFDNLPFTFDVKNYNDTIHFSLEMSYKVLEYIRDDKYLLNSDNINDYIEEFKKGIYSFDLVKFHDDLDFFIKKRTNK
ncbi:hypothetical protein SAMN02910357_01992 [Succinivibrio dextrinosolvens]|uniref:hypothetical protein n=1 Tax=Succinivibrio dextrinosolvens TaxID=83771 RepID=UPI0008F08D20|nr:hypothetical protein [Succinivibrio dextrinosolvens]SFS81472.1 hypothetical protein SAMN02910357_01992 [Succinivibrio dextrinosolvens]